MLVRVHYTDTLTGSVSTEDIDIAALNALAIADAMRETDYEQLDGVFLEMRGDSGVFVLRGDDYMLAGTIYTVF